MPRRIFASFLPFLLLALTSIKASADDLDHISLEGVITDAAGARLPGAKVTARSASTGLERAALSDGEGRYRLTTLAPGEYELRVEAGGFRAVNLRFAAPAGTTVRRDFRLEVAAVAAEITVEADGGEIAVDASRTVVGGTLTRAEVDDLPLDSRNVYDLLFTLPGVAEPAFDERLLAEGDTRDGFRRAPEEAGVFALNGGTPFSNNLTIEGLDNNDDRAARERFTPTLDAVEEVQVVTNQFSSEYGRASGGRVNLRLRGGSNNFRGRAFYYFRDESLNANPHNRNSDPARGFRLPYQNHNPGVTFGGPVVRNRAHFFAAYEYDNVYDRADISALVPVAQNAAFPLPSPTGANLGSTAVDRTGRQVVVNGGAAVGLYDVQVTTPRRAHTLQARGDLKLSDNHTAFAVLTFARNRDERSFPGGRRTLDTLRATGRDSQALAFADNLVISPRAVNQLRFQFSRLTPADAPPNRSPVVIIDIDDPRDVIGQANSNPLTRAGTLLAGSSTISGTDRREDRYQVQETFSYVAGRHSLRVGFDVQAIRSRFVDLNDTTGTFRFASVADFLTGKPARYTHRFLTSSELRNTYTGLFVQDDWRVRPNLTLAFGLRWDNETILADRDNFGPRVALAWSPFENNKTVVRAGSGIFYNRALLRTLDDYTLTSNKLLLDTNNAAAARLLTELQFPKVLGADDSRVAQLGVREAGFVRRLEQGFRIPESYQAALGVEREIARGLKVEVNYVFNRGLHLWRESNANAPRLPAGFASFTDYLTSRDFPNAPDPVTGVRPVTSFRNADVVRFDLSTTSGTATTSGGKTTAVFGLGNTSTSNSTNAFRAALAAVRGLRPNPQLTQVEELQSRGNSYYHGVNFELQARLRKRGSVRVAYTLGRLIDDGVVNTSSPLVVGDFRRERALSLLDSRHRFALSWTYHTPAGLGAIDLAGIFTASSPRPFNLGINGNDRNLDDVSNDRPNFSGDLGAINWRRSGAPLDAALASAFSLPPIGSAGNLPRNAGRGPAQHTLSLRAARVFRLGERRRLTPQVEVFNPLNSTVFNFGAEFVDFTPTSLGGFLTPVRTLRARTMRAGVRFEF
jgi:hypothetical protein